MQAMKASLPALSACIHVAASTSDDSDLGPLRGPSELVKRIGVIFSKLLHGVSHGANRRLLVQLGEAPGMALIPTTGNTRFDAWLLVHLLSNAECTNLLRSLLDWQNGLRVSLSSLLSARKDAAQVTDSHSYPWFGLSLTYVSALQLHLELCCSRLSCSLCVEDRSVIFWCTAGRPN